MGLKEWYKKKEREKEINIKEKWSRRTQIPNEQIQTWKGPFWFSKNEVRGKGIDRERSLVLIIGSWLDPHMFGKENNLLLWE
jgi:hypothetical protein